VVGCCGDVGGGVVGVGVAVVVCVAVCIGGVRYAFGVAGCGCGYVGVGSDDVGWCCVIVGVYVVCVCGVGGVAGVTVC